MGLAYLLHDYSRFPASGKQFYDYRVSDTDCVGDRYQQ